MNTLIVMNNSLTHPIPVRFDPESYKRVVKVVRSRKQSFSAFLREATDRLLPIVEEEIAKRDQGKGLI